MRLLTPRSMLSNKFRRCFAEYTEKYGAPTCRDFHTPCSIASTRRALSCSRSSTRRVTRSSGHSQKGRHANRRIDADRFAPGHAERKRQHRPLTMTIVQLPRLSAQASKLWNAIPIDARRKILANVYCGHCRGGVSIINVVGTLKGGDLVLHGNCAVCAHNVARHIEGPNA